MNSLNVVHKKPLTGRKVYIYSYTSHALTHLETVPRPLSTWCWRSMYGRG